MENLRDEYPHVFFADMDFDGPAAHNIIRLPEVRTFTGLPFTIYYKNGKVVMATSSIQNDSQVTSILDKYFSDGKAD
jgi:thioredoxin 1